MIDTAIARRIVALMNEAVELDPAAVSALLSYRVACNPALTDHPTIQVGHYPDPTGPMSVGLGGILNGIAGANGDDLGAVAAIVEEDGSVSGFVVIEDRLEVEDNGD